ncbi:MAG: hypothetical protein ABIJ21_04120 [Nanoarchaeota archaeon]
MKGRFEASKYILVFFLFSYTLVSLVVFFFLFQDGFPTGRAIGPPPSIVTRSFNATVVDPGKEIAVTLTLQPLWDETFYALEEAVPQAFTILDNGGANTDQDPYTLRWYYINLNDPNAIIPPEELVKTYHIRAPQNTGTYPFSGIFQFDRDPAPANTTNLTTGVVTVSLSCTDECTDGTTTCTDDGFSILTCGNWDADPCTEWGGQTACGTLNCNADTCTGVSYNDFPLFNSGSRGTCQRTCNAGACVDCNTQTGVCLPFTESCTQGKQCQASAQACGGISRTCHNNGAWVWDSITAETQCRDTYDNDCDNTCDYDGENCAIGSTHGDLTCPVEIQAISVSNANPEENTVITVSCTANAQASSVFATIEGTSCTGTITWNGNIAEVPCNVGAYSPDPKTVTCRVNHQKSYQTGENLSTTITLRQSVCTGLPEPECTGSCEWCPECSGTQGNGLGGAACVPDGSCTYSCDITSTCGAMCDIINDCPLFDCEDTCVDATHILVIPDVAGTCDYDLCGCDYASCGTGTERACTPTTCEETYPSQHLVGTCDNTCEILAGDDACTACTPTYPTDCACEDGWYDSDNDPLNGCESDIPPECTESWSCTEWSGDGCGDRTCTCPCPGGVGCSGDNTEHIECATSGGRRGGGGGGGNILPNKCENGYDDEGSPARQNGCIDDKDWWCGGTETYCWGGVDNDCDGHIDCDDTDCALDRNCQEEIVTPGEEPPVYSISTILENIFLEKPEDQATEPETFSTSADVQGFFGFINWTIIAIIAILFLGLIFIDHIRPGGIQTPKSQLDAVGFYIFKKLNEGKSSKEIRMHLKAVGWIDEVIDDNFKKAEAIRSAESHKADSSQAKKAPPAS